MSEDKYPEFKTFPDYDGTIDGAYIRLSDGKSHHCKEWELDSDLIFDYDSSDRLVGLEILCPTNDLMIEKVKETLESSGVGEAEIEGIEMELDKLKVQSIDP